MEDTSSWVGEDDKLREVEEQALDNCSSQVSNTCVEYR